MSDSLSGFGRWIVRTIRPLGAWTLAGVSTWVSGNRPEFRVVVVRHRIGEGA